MDLLLSLLSSEKLQMVLMIIGGLRIVVKPLMTILKELALYTPSKKDDELIGKAESSMVYKGIVYIVDWFASVKLPGAK